MLYHLTRKSDNAKTGPIPVSTSSAETCPPTCPFNRQNEGGCYAAVERLALHWSKVSDGTRGVDFGTFCESIASLPAGQIWRHNQAGDLPGVGAAVDASALAKLAEANRGRRGFTYTHKPVLGSDPTAEANREAIRQANGDGFTVNVSADNLADADAKAELEAGPVAVVLPSTADHSEAWEATRRAPATLATPQGRPVVICPATYRPDVTCAACGLCQRVTRRVIVGFPAHGPAKRKASEVASR